MHGKRWWIALAMAAAVAGCKKKEPAKPAPAPPAEASAATAATAQAEAATPTAAAAPEAATPAAAPDDPLKNGWSLPPRGTEAKEGERVFVLTQGKDRSYLNTSAVYHLFAYDLGEVAGERVQVKELGGGTFAVTGLFVVPAGTSEAGKLKAGDPVLAEWASEMKHAVVQKVDGEKVVVRYTDLPESWKEEQLQGELGLRQVTKQQDGLHPGNFASAPDPDGKPMQVLLINASGDKWLARKFNGRVDVFAAKDLVPLPIKPVLKVGQTVQAPWIGMMYKAKVKKVSAFKAEVVLEGAQVKEPVGVPLGQLLPEAK